jgi:peroxidase
LCFQKGENGQPIECCKTEEIHPECLPVPIEKGDPYFDDYNATCLNFVRSIPAPTGIFGKMKAKQYQTLWFSFILLR